MCRGRLVGVSLLATLAMACGADRLTVEGVATDTGQLDAAIRQLTAERDELLIAQEQMLEDLGSLEEELETARSQAEAAGDAFSTADAGRSSALGDLEAAEGEIESLSAEAAVLADDLEQATAENERLRLLYDEEIRADILLLVNDAVETACAAARGDVSQAAGDFLAFDEEWEVVLSRAEAVASVEECARPEREVLLANQLAAEFAARNHRTRGWAQDRLGVDNFGFRVPDPTSDIEGYPVSAEETVALAQEFCDALRARNVLAQLSVASGPDAESEWFEVAAYGSFCPDVAVTVVSGGVHIVGTEPGQLPPGTYQSSPGVDECYWERTRANGDIIDNDFVSFAAGGVIVRVAASDASVEFGCGSMVLVG